MSRFSGKQDFSGPKAGRKNKGVLAACRTEKRVEAEERNAHTPYPRTAAYRRDIAPAHPHPISPARPRPVPAPRPKPAPTPPTPQPGR